MKCLRGENLNYKAVAKDAHLQNKKINRSDRSNMATTWNKMVPVINLCISQILQLFNERLKSVYKNLHLLPIKTLYILTSCMFIQTQPSCKSVIDLSQVVLW